MRYELHDEELAVFFTADELNVAVAYENVMHRPRGISSGELLYACIVDSINEKSGVPAIDWKKTPHSDRAGRMYPDSVETRDGRLVVRTTPARSPARRS